MVCGGAPLDLYGWCFGARRSAVRGLLLRISLRLSEVRRGSYDGISDSGVSVTGDYLVI